MASTEVETPETKHGQAIVEKPLNATQAKNLKEIISSDFNELQFRLQKEVDTRRSEKLAIIAAQFGSDDILEEVQAEAEEMVVRMREEIDAWYASADARGIIAPGGARAVFAVNSTTYNMKYRGNEQKVGEINAASNRLKELISGYVQQLRRAAERNILLATVTGGVASQLLNEIPGIDDAMQTVLGQVAQDGIAEVRALMADAGAGNTPSLTA